jgi:hypothetical protein
MKRRRPPPEVATEAALLREGAARGFVLTLARRDGARTPLHGAALGASDGRGLGLVLVIGPDRAAVEEAARRVARSHLGA